MSKKRQGDNVIILGKPIEQTAEQIGKELQALLKQHVQIQEDLVKQTNEIIKGISNEPRDKPKNN